MAVPWCKRLDTCLSTLRSLVRVSITPSGFRGGRNGVCIGFSRGSSRFPLPQIPFHNISTFISFISFHVISFAPVMVQAWSADFLATHRPPIKGLHRISSLDLVLCRKRVEDFFIYFKRKVVQFYDILKRSIIYLIRLLTVAWSFIRMFNSEIPVFEARW